MNIKNMIFGLLVNIIPIMATVYIIVGIRLFKQRVKTNVNYFSFLMFVCAIYSFGYFLELNCEYLTTFTLVRNFEFLGSTFIPTFGILFVAELTEIKVSKKLKSILITLSAFLWILFISDPLHHLIYKSIDLRIVNGFGIVDAVRGPAFYSLLPYYAAFLIFSNMALAKAYNRTDRPNRAKSLVFLRNSFYIAWIAILFSLIDFDTYIDPATVTIMILATLFAINEIKNDMFQLQTKMWMSTYEYIGEPAFLIDKGENIICSNVISNSLFYNLGKNIHDFIGNLDDGEINRNQVLLETNSGIRYFDVKKSIFDIKKGFVNYLLIDITDGKLAEERLKESEAKYRMIFENVPLGLLYFDNKGTITDCNDNFTKIIGTSRFHLLGLNILKLTDKNLVHALQSTLKGEITTYEGDYKSFTSDKVTPVRVIFAPIISEDKETKAGVGIVEDITKRKLAEDALKESERSKSVLLSNLPGMSYRCSYNRDWTMEFLSKGCYELTGYKETELMYNKFLSFNDIILPEYRDYLWNCWEDAVSSRTPVQVEYKIRTADQKEKWVWEHGIPIYDAEGSVEALEGFIIDINDRKKFETSLSNEKNLFKTTLVSIGDGVISTDNQGNVVILNKVAEQLTGWTQIEAFGKPLEKVFNIINEFTRERCDNAVNKVFSTCDIIEAASNKILVSKDNTEKSIEDSAAPIKDEKGNISGVVLVFRDFTEKKQRQEEIKYLSYHDQLTGLYNRRFYEEELRRLDTERNLPLTIVMGDVNGLKLVNDSFGHVMGDSLLKKVSELLKHVCRGDDIIARLGGDEFVILLPKTDSNEAEQIINRVTACSLVEKVGAIDISISFGYETKNIAEENIEEIFKKSEDHMYKKKLFESPSMRGKTISAIIRTLHEKNKREEQHSHRVSALCESMGESLNFPKYEIQELKTVGLLHDIGKIAIDENILNKPGKLTNEEWEEIRRHPEISYRILSTVNDMSQMAEYVLAHHERWDGKGYPKGLKGEDIPLVARIITIADSYDAMTSERSYRSALTEEVAIAELQKNAGLQFDSNLLKIFIEKVLGKANDV